MAQQQMAMNLWTAGEYDRAKEQWTALGANYPGHQRGKASYYHIANHLEHLNIVEAQSCREVQEILEEARNYYRRALDAVHDPSNYIALTSRKGIDQVNDKLDVLERINRGQMKAQEAVRRLDAMDAHGAVVAFLEPYLKSDAADGEFYTFLSLIYRTQFIENLIHRMDEIEARLKTDQPDLFLKGYEHFLPLAERAAQEAIARSEQAVARFPGSSRLLDFHVYLGQAHRYDGLMDLRRRSVGARLKAADADFPDISATLEKFKRARIQSKEVYKLAREWLNGGKPEMSEAQAAAYDRATLQRYRRTARQSMKEIGALISRVRKQAK